MNCAQCQELLAEYALDTLEVRDQQRVDAHLATGCEACQRQLREFTASWTALPELLSPVAPDPQIKVRLLERLRAESRSPSASTPSAQEPFQFTPVAEPELVSSSRGETGRATLRSVFPYVAATLLGLLAGYWFGSSDPRERALAQRYQAERVESERAFGANQVFLASLDRSDGQPKLPGHLIWDGIAGQLHVYAFDLPAPAEGSAYHLWFVSDEDRTKSEAWTFVGELSEQSPGLYAAVLELPKLNKSWSQAIVTLEPSNPGKPSPEKPRGPVRMQGNVQ